MPYITEDRRIKLEFDYASPHSSGELNYLLTERVWEYFLSNGRNYTAINDVLGALEGAKLEFYRRVASPYEDKKKEENGDVYET